MALKSRGTQTVSIQQGSLRGKRITLPPAVHGHRHFTSSLMKEAFFQLVEPCASGPFFDLCAGSGQMAVEALSRGFAPVHCVERDERRFQFLVKELVGLSLVFHKKDFRRMAPALASVGGVAYLDVPYTFWSPTGQCPHVEEFLKRLRQALEEHPQACTVAIQSPAEMTWEDSGLAAWIQGHSRMQSREYRGHFLLLLSFFEEAPSTP